MMKKVGVVNWIAAILLIIGGLNWGLIGFFNLDLISLLFGSGSAVSRVIFSLVGLAALWAIFCCCKCRCKCGCKCGGCKCGCKETCSPKDPSSN